MSTHELGFPVAMAPALAAEPVALAREVIAHHSKSFALASKLLPRAVRDEAVVLYAYCRRVDDAIDAVAFEEQPRALACLHAELDQVYGGATPHDPLLAALQSVVRARGIPRQYPEELLAGMAMDVQRTRYTTLHELLGYAYRVAGVVGLMMCHVMGVRRPEALARAAQLGIAMQLSNIARDVAEDWSRGRRYLPDELLLRHGGGAQDARLGGPLPKQAVPSVAHATSELLALADRYYRSGEAGLTDLAPRCALAVDAARLVYADIGRAVRAQGCDPLKGRAVVGNARKLWLLARAALRALWRPPNAWRAARVAPPTQTLSCEAAVAPRRRSLVNRVAVVLLCAACAWVTSGFFTRGRAAAADAAALGTVTVELLGVESSKGQLLAALFRDSRGFPDGGAKAFATRVQRARAGTMRVTFDRIPKGPFAVTVHHDEDSDFAMDTGLFGIPTEGYGFSRNAHAPFGPPGFDDCRLVLAPGQHARLSIRLRY